MDNGREFTTVKQAIDMLPDTEYIHTFRQGGMGMLIGADWERNKLISAIKKSKPELTGERAQSMGHGLAFEDDTGIVFVETKKKETTAND